MFARFVDWLRFRISVFPFPDMPDWLWAVTASPLLRFALGGRPGERWWQGWFVRPFRGPFSPADWRLDE